MGSNSPDDDDDLTKDNKDNKVSSDRLPKKRPPSKLMACMTKHSLDTFRSKAIFSLAMLDSNGIRRRKFPLYECIILELKEAGYCDSSAYLQDLIYDNVQLVNQDDIGIVVDLRKREDYLEHISGVLQKVEKYRERNNTMKECTHLLKLAMHYAEREKGILWLAEKFYQVAIAVSSKHLLDGGRLKAIFPGADPEEPFSLLTEVRDSAIGKTWPLSDAKEPGEVLPTETVFGATALQLHRVLLDKARAVRKTDTAKAERLARLAERRAKDAGETVKTAEAIIEIGICQLMMNNLNNAQKTFERAFKIHEWSGNVEGLCETRMHLAALGGDNKIGMDSGKEGQMGEIYIENEDDIYEEEAEQSRLMTAISAGQELMASYFNLLREAGGCTVAKMKTIEWKLSHARWWVKRLHHDFLPCPCPVHHRTPLDVLTQIECKKSLVHVSLFDFSNEALGRTSTIQDIRKLHSSFVRSRTSHGPPIDD
ncbi:hypothetical protein SFRURICE_019891 [Spodoptera frugiperda]|nr:hypothetical protein SFRURICE_019891 [Spodoptera frugiperda]